MRQDLRCGSAFCPGAPVETVEESAADFVLPHHYRHSFFLRLGGRALAAAVGVHGQSLLEFVSDAKIIDHQPAGLVSENAIHTRDRLHERMAAHGLVNVHRVQRRYVKAGEPHVTNYDDLQRILRFFKALGQCLATRLVARVRGQLRPIGGRARHYDLEDAVCVVVVVPRRTKRYDLLVQLDANASAHADDHRLTIHGFKARLEVIDQIFRD